MKQQINIFIASLKKARLWLVLYFLLLLTNYYFIVNMNEEIIRSDVLGILGIIQNINSIFSVDFLFFLYQIFAIVYVIHVYFNFEKSNSEEFILCRLSKRKLFTCKTILASLILILFRVYYFLVVYCLFKEYVTFSFLDFVLNIVEYIFVLIVYTILFLLYNRKYKVY